ncbi:hypothetical protein HMPREF1992_01106 [Selenomonas sp. oral taxon 892 str. F0426]|nr:hypothetical protein HMPREF1992_01106 [Selenomonas sp. oral taxon 892 str. F0426]
MRCRANKRPLREYAGTDIITNYIVSSIFEITNGVMRISVKEVSICDTV